jgi:hypothetical protein
MRSCAHSAVRSGVCRGEGCGEGGVIGVQDWLKLIRDGDALRGGTGFEPAIDLGDLIDLEREGLGGEALEACTLNRNLVLADLEETQVVNSGTVGSGDVGDSVLVLIAVTLAPGITEPVESVTTHVMEPVIVCA